MKTCETYSDIMPMVRNIDQNAKHARNSAIQANIWYIEHIREALNRRYRIVEAEKKQTKNTHFLKMV